MTTLRPTLVLNASFEPVTITSLKRALKLVLKGAAVVEEVSGHIRSGKDKFDAPSVIRLREYRRVPRQTRALSRKNILLRDGYRCQYCHKEPGPAKLTLDHVVPRAQGGESTWQNLVASCKSCNNRKGARTPEQAGMPLARQPKPFSIHTSRALMRMSGAEEATWRKYLYYDNAA